MKSISFLLAVSFGGAGALVALIGDAELGIMLGAAAASMGRFAGSACNPAREIRTLQPRAIQPAAVTVEDLTGTYARLLSELPVLPAEASSGRERRLRIARLTQQLAEAHWALAEARAKAKWTLPGRIRNQNEPAIRKDWTHRFSRRLREHEPAMPARDAMDISRTMYTQSRWRSASPEAAVDLELLELELIGSAQVRGGGFDA